jgi:hypothetical protein
MPRVSWKTALKVRPGHVMELRYLHDDWCAKLTQGRECDCDALVQVIHHECCERYTKPMSEAEALRLVREDP